MAKVLYVDTVTAFLTKKLPPQLVVNVTGRTSSSGWTGGALSERHYLVPPSDGILDLEFYAEPPSGMSLQVLSPIAASKIIECPTWCKGARVHASLNEIEERAFGVDVEVLSRKGTDRDPGGSWPWMVASETLAANRQKVSAFFEKSGDANSVASELVGRPVRMFHESDMITMDHLPDRVNIVLKDGTKLILHVYFG